MMRRRNFIKMTTLGLAALVVGPMLSRAASRRRGQFEITKTDEEWRTVLTEQQYFILRKAGTERPFTSPYLNEKRAGLYHCAGCNLALYDARSKYDSKTGWPSFTVALANAVRTQPDNSLFMTRTEVHCRRCGGHLGHVFNDGPAPTGKRHCINGAALVFRAA